MLYWANGQPIPRSPPAGKGTRFGNKKVAICRKRTGLDWMQLYHWHKADTLEARLFTDTIITAES